jgi:hypothetical protein
VTVTNPISGLTSVAAPANVARTTVSNTFAERQVFTKVAYSPETALTDGATIAWDLDVAPNAKVTLGGDRTLSNPSNMVAGATYKLRVIQDGTGNRLLTFSANYKAATGLSTTLVPTAGGLAPFHLELLNTR